MRKDRDRTGFTLIELLIVVAIIAILAMIAVPNFLEAQTRAKVSRVRNDMRSLATALEAYYTDWNSYTNIDQGDNPNGYYVEGFKQLTTPVAYIAFVPHDAFGDYRDLQVVRRAMYELGTGSAGAKYCSGTPKNPDPRGFPSDTWIIRSTGPDKIDDTVVNTYPWRNVPDNDTGVATVIGWIYDPTNGTVSSGDIYRVGGMKPAGRPFDALFAASSR